MKKLHFLFSNGAKFSLEVPKGTNIRKRVELLVSFVKDNDKHVTAHKGVYSSGSRVKFPKRQFFVGFDNGDGKIQTLITPESRAIKYSGKALLLDTLCTEIEYRVNALTTNVPFVGCAESFTQPMLTEIERDEQRKQQKLLAAG